MIVTAAGSRSPMRLLTDIATRVYNQRDELVVDGEAEILAPRRQQSVELTQLPPISIGCWVFTLGVFTRDGAGAVAVLMGYTSVES